MMDRKAYILKRVQHIAEEVRTANPGLPEVKVRWINLADGGCGGAPPSHHDDEPWVRAHAHPERPYTPYNNLICLFWPTEPDWFIWSDYAIAELMAHEILHITLPDEDHLSKLFKRREKEIWERWREAYHPFIEVDPVDALL